MWAGVDDGCTLACELNVLAHVLVVEHQAVEERVEVGAAAFFGGAVDAAGVGHAFAHQVFHFAQVVPQFVFFAGVVHELGAQFHAGDRGLQVVGDCREQLHAFLQVRRDACLHRVEGLGGVGDFGRAFFVQEYGMGVGVQGFDGTGEAGEGADGDSDRQPGAGQHQRQLPEQHDGQPGRQRHHRRADVDGQRAAIRQVQVHLKMFFRPGNVGKGHRVIVADGVLDRGNGNGRIGHVGADGRARRTLIEHVAVIAPLQLFEPSGSLVGGQAVEDGNGRGNVGFQVAEHGGFRGFVAFVVLRAEGQRLGEDQADQEYQRQPRGQGPRPMQRQGHD
ncbi:hypothetical protein D3C86_1224650 [compost metagenome]